MVVDVRNKPIAREQQVHSKGHLHWENMYSMAADIPVLASVLIIIILVLCRNNIMKRERKLPVEAANITVTVKVTLLMEDVSMMSEQ